MVRCVFSFLPLRHTRLTYMLILRLYEIGSCLFLEHGAVSESGRGRVFFALETSRDCRKSEYQTN